MDEEPTTAVVQRYLLELASDSPAEPVNLQPEEMLGAVVERLIEALRDARPSTLGQFFALALPAHALGTE
jgi:RNA polymerase sigma-70 factor (ECF subfamily)